MARLALLALLVVGGLWRSEEAISDTWLHYACKPNGDMSVRIPMAQVKEYMQAWVGGHQCNVTYTPYVANTTGVYLTDAEDTMATGADYKFLYIDDCADSLTEDIALLFDVKPFKTNMIGGKGFTPYTIGCRLQGNPRLTNISIVTSLLYTSPSNYDPIVSDYPAVDVTTYNMLGDTGYTVFTMGYPIYTEFLGPPTTSFLPKTCVAYNPHNAKTKELVKNGCSLGPKLMTSFFTNVTDWTQKPVTNITDEGMLLEAEAVGEEEAEEEVEEEPERPRLWADIKAFRFRGSKQLTIECTFTACNNGDPDCDIDCTTTTTTATMAGLTTASTTAGLTGASTIAGTTESETEAP